jgi:hypothetical protein
LEEKKTGAPDMPLSSLTATTEYAPEPRYRQRERRSAQDRAARSEPAAAAPAPAQGAFDATFYASRFKTDLTQLRAFEGAEGAERPTACEVEPGLAEFFGNLSTLLVAVRAGDILRAQAAADALELDALVERNAVRRPGDCAPLLDDLVGQLAASQASGQTAARVAARELAGEFDPGLSPIALPDAYAEAEPPDDGGAVYDTLRHYLGDGPGAV